MKKISFIIVVITIMISSCKNGDWEFPDNEFSVVYFPYQSPVRTITLGRDDVNDNTLDNQWQCQIMATVQGMYQVKNDVEISFRVENSLCNGLDNVTAMPSHYYSLSDNSKIIIKKNSKTIGGVVVTLTEAFFNDPLATTVNYVIPLLITDVKNADRILSGTAAVDNPNRFIAGDWEVQPKDYILWAIKYINPYDVIYLRRGTDHITLDGVQSTEKRQGTYATVDDEVIRLNSLSLTEIEFPVNNHRLNNLNLNMTFKLNFTNDGKCTFANGAWKNSQLVDEYTGDNFRVYDIVVSGNGEYRTNGEKNSWGEKDRDALYLTYQTQYKVDRLEEDEENLPQWVTYEIKYVTEDILVFRDRGIKGEWFTPVLKP